MIHFSKHGPHLADATCYAWPTTDVEMALTCAVELTPLVDEPERSGANYFPGCIAKFRDEVAERRPKLG